MKRIKDLLLITFQVFFISYFTLIILDVFTKNFVSYYINLTIWLWIVLISGLLTLWLKYKY